MIPGKTKAAQALRKAAMRHAGAEESVACAGTKLECATIGVKKKVFLFLFEDGGALTARVKLRESAAEAKKLAKREPERYAIGANGWAKIAFGEADAPIALLERWIDESHRAVAGA